MLYPLSSEIKITVYEDPVIYGFKQGNSIVDYIDIDINKNILVIIVSEDLFSFLISFSQSWSVLPFNIIDNIAIEHNWQSHLSSIISFRKKFLLVLPQFLGWRIYVSLDTLKTMAHSTLIPNYYLWLS